MPTAHFRMPVRVHGRSFSFKGFWVGGILSSCALHIGGLQNIKCPQMGLLGSYGPIVREPQASLWLLEVAVLGSFPAPGRFKHCSMTPAALSTCPIRYRTERTLLLRFVARLLHPRAYLDPPHFWTHLISISTAPCPRSCVRLSRPGL